MRGLIHAGFKSLAYGENHLIFFGTQILEKIIDRINLGVINVHLIVKMGSWR